MILRASLPMYDLPEVRKWTDRLWARDRRGVARRRRRRRAGLARASVRPPRRMAQGRAAVLADVRLSGGDGASRRAAGGRDSALRRARLRRPPLLECRGGARGESRRRPGRAARGSVRIQLARFPVRVQRASSGDRSDRARRAVLRAHRRDRRPRREHGGGALRAGRRLRGRLRDVGAACPPSSLGARRARGGVPHRAGSGIAVRDRRRRLGRDLESVRSALVRAFDRADLAATREALLIRGVSTLPIDAYEPLLAMERAAAASGYPRLD